MRVVTLTVICLGAMCLLACPLPSDSTEARFFKHWTSTDADRPAEMLSGVVSRGLSVSPRIVSMSNIISQDDADHIIALAEGTIKSETPDPAPGKPAPTVGTTLELGRFLGVQDLVVDSVTSRLAAALGYEPEYFGPIEVSRFNKGQHEGGCAHEFDVTTHNARNPASSPGEYTVLFNRGVYVVGENVDRIVTITLPLSAVAVGGGGEYVFPLVEGQRLESEPTITEVALNMTKRAGALEAMCSAEATTRAKHRVGVGSALVQYNTRPDGSADLGSYRCMCPITKGTGWVARVHVHSRRVNVLNSCHMLVHVPYLVPETQVPGETYLGCDRRHLALLVAQPETAGLLVSSPLQVLAAQTSPEFSVSFFLARHRTEEAPAKRPLFDIAGTLAVGTDETDGLFLACRNIDTPKPRALMMQAFEDPEAAVPRDSVYRHVALTFRTPFGGNGTEVVLYVRGEEVAIMPIHPECFIRDGKSAFLRPTLLFHLKNEEIADFTAMAYPLEMPDVARMYEEGRHRLPVPESLWPGLLNDPRQSAISKRLWGERFKKYPFSQTALFH